MQTDQAKLLRSLSIERWEDGQTASSPRAPVRSVALIRTAIVVSTAIVIGTAAFGYWNYRRQPSDEKGEAISTANVQRTETQAAAPAPPTQAQNLIASGYIVARRKSVVGSEISGKIAEILVDEGDYVEAHQPVARLDKVLADADLELSSLRSSASGAAVDAVAADLEDAERISDRTKILWGKGFATAADLTKNEARVSVLRAQLSQARAQLNNARRDVRRSGELLDKYTIYAPFSGIVTERDAEVGEIIAPAGAGGTNSFTRTGICTIVNRESIEAEVDINEASIGRVRIGANVSVVPDAFPDWTIPGTVAAIVPAASREKGTVRVRIVINNKDRRIIADMGVKIIFREL